MPQSNDNAIKVNGKSPPAGFPAGWLLQHDIPTSRKSREAVWRGPATSVGAALDYLRGSTDWAKWALSASRHPGSLSAEIRATRQWGGGGGGGEGPSYESLKVSPDTWSLKSVSTPVALAAAPAFADVGAIEAIDDAILRGDVRRARDIAGAEGGAAEQYLGLRLAGISSYDAVGWTYNYVNHLAAGAEGFDSVKSEVESAQQCAMSVVEWGDVKGVLSAPFAEPKWLDGDGEASSYEWRCDGVEFGFSNDELAVSFVYTGCWKWAKALYSGGTWEPSAGGD